MRAFSCSVVRARTPQACWSNILDGIEWSEKYGRCGVLPHDRNDAFTSPWLAAQLALARIKRLSPVFDVDPIHMTPISAAGPASSLTQIHGHRIYLNIITGTALSHLEAMRDAPTLPALARRPAGGEIGPHRQGASAQAK